MFGTTSIFGRYPALFLINGTSVRSSGFAKSKILLNFHIGKSAANVKVNFDYSVENVIKRNPPRASSNLGLRFVFRSCGFDSAENFI